MIAWFAETTAVAAILAALAWGMTKAGRLGPATRHALWLLVLVKMVTPPLVRWPFALAPPAIRASPETSPEAMAEPLEISRGEPIFFEDSELPPQTDESSPTTADTIAESDEFAGAEEVTTPTVPGPPRDFRPMILGVWLAGSAAFAGWQVVRICRFRRHLRGSKPLPEWLERQADDVAARLGVRAPRGVVAHCSGSPFLWCAGRSTLVVPGALLPHFDSVSWEGILSHELAHVRRGDPWVCRLSLAAGVLWWWNPLYWIVKGRLESEAELACDALAVGSRPEARRQYAETLVDVCEFTSLARVPRPALGMGGAGKFLERRLTMILQGQETGRMRRGGFAVVAMLAIVAAPSWTRGQDQPPKPEAPVPPSALPEAPKPPEPPRPADVSTSTSRTTSTATANGVEVKVTTSEDVKPEIRVSGDVKLAVVPDDDPKAAIAEAQSQLRKAQKELLASEVRLRKAEQDLKLAAEQGRRRAESARRAPASDLPKLPPRVMRRVEVRIDKDGKLLSVTPAELNAMGLDAHARGAIDQALAGLKGVTVNGAAAPPEIDALNRRMDAMEKKIDALLNELKARPARPAPPAAPRRRPGNREEADPAAEDAEKPEAIAPPATVEPPIRPAKGVEPFNFFMGAFW